MKEEITNRKGSILMPFLAGGFVGAGVALMLAPQPGSETRRDLKRIADRFSQAVDIGKDLYGESREFANKAVEAGKKAYREERPLEPITNARPSLLVPILASGVVGAGVALLLTQTGNETRKDLKRLASTTRKKVVSTIDKGKDLYVEGKQRIMQAV